MTNSRSVLMDISSAYRSTPPADAQAGRQGALRCRRPAPLIGIRLCDERRYWRLGPARRFRRARLRQAVFPGRQGRRSAGRLQRGARRPEIRAIFATRGVQGVVSYRRPPRYRGRPARSEVRRRLQRHHRTAPRPRQGLRAGRIHGSVMDGSGSHPDEHGPAKAAHGGWRRAAYRTDERKHGRAHHRRRASGRLIGGNLEYDRGMRRLGAAEARRRDSAPGGGGDADRPGRPPTHHVAQGRASRRRRRHRRRPVYRLSAEFRRADGDRPAARPSGAARQCLSSAACRLAMATTGCRSPHGTPAMLDASGRDSSTVPLADRLAA